MSFYTSLNLGVSQALVIDVLPRCQSPKRTTKTPDLWRRGCSLGLSASDSGLSIAKESYALTERSPNTDVENPNGPLNQNPDPHYSCGVVDGPALFGQPTGNRCHCHKNSHCQCIRIASSTRDSAMSNCGIVQYGDFTEYNIWTKSLFPQWQPFSKAYWKHLSASHSAARRMSVEAPP